MSPPPDDAPPPGQEPPRKWRADRRAEGRRASSGTWLVAGVVASVLLIWWGLDRSFRGWRDRQQARAMLGASEVAPLVDPLARFEPPGVSPPDWRSAVLDTHAMLLALTASGVLGDDEIGRLRQDLAARVGKVETADQARRALAALWDDVEGDYGFAIAPDHGPPPPPNSRQARRLPHPPRPRALGPSKAPNAFSR